MYDYDGYTDEKEFNIDGNDDDILFFSTDDASIGKHSLGKEPIGSSRAADKVLNKFRIKHEHQQNDYFEIQFYYYSDTVDAQWEILANGSNVQLSTMENAQIKK